jgi:hypothetical protein
VTERHCKINYCSLSADIRSMPALILRPTRRYWIIISTSGCSLVQHFHDREGYSQVFTAGSAGPTLRVGGRVQTSETDGHLPGWPSGAVSRIFG